MNPRRRTGLMAGAFAAMVATAFVAVVMKVALPEIEGVSESWGPVLQWIFGVAVMACALSMIAGITILYSRFVMRSYFPPSPPPFPTCKKCEYPLIGLPEPRCPECGTPFDSQRPSSD